MKSWRVEMWDSVDRAWFVVKTYEWSSDAIANFDRQIAKGVSTPLRVVRVVRSFNPEAKEEKPS